MKRKWVSDYGVIFLVVLNIVLLFLGGGLLTVGIFMATADRFQSTDVISLLSKVVLAHTFNLQPFIDVLTFMTISAGGATLIASACGIFGVIFKKRAPFIVYVAFLVMCILYNLVVLGFWCSFLNAVYTSLEYQFTTIIRSYNGPTSTDVHSAGWNAIFVLYNCCGVSAVSATYNDFSALATSWWSSGTRGSDLIPESCCLYATIDNYETYHDTRCTQSWTGYHTSGCHTAFNNLYTQLGSSVIAACVIFTLVAVACVVFCTLIVSEEINSERKRREMRQI